MCEVTEKNFEQLYPQIINDLHAAAFISFDCEFSGLFDDGFQCSLLDSPSVRFEKLQKCLDSVSIIQFGLSTFKYERPNNSFEVASYSFYLRPSTALKEQKFTYHMGSVEFLCKHKFNFNKLFYDGVFYLNKSYEKLAWNVTEKGFFFNLNHRTKVQQYCSQVVEWSRNAIDGDEMMIDLSNEPKTFVYILHREIRTKFLQVWTFFDENNVIRVKKLKESDRANLLLSEQDNYVEKKLFDSILGFTKVIKEIENLEKPIVGHNVLIDLILIYKQFFNPYPVSYKYFKNAISKIFPILYDTKVMSFRLKDIISKDNAWTSNNLSSLYQYLRHGKGSNLVIFTPQAQHRITGFTDENNFHEAGFDSYCTGYCFLKMAHIFSLWDDQKKAILLTPLQISSKWLLGAASKMKNQVNVPRAQVNYIVLDGKDPRSVRPSLLYIYSKTKQPLDVPKILEIMARYTTIDIQLLSPYSCLVAAGNHIQVREIYEYFKNHSDYRVTKYNFLKHSKPGKCIISGTILFSFVFFAIFIKRSLVS